MTIEPDSWEYLYKERWNKTIVKEAYAHPAKFARGVTRKMYDHAIENGWIASGSLVLDPFCGVALGALEARLHGLRWVGVELEQRFYELAQANLAKWDGELSAFENMGSASILHGDSRRLREIIRESADVVVSSPPYAETRIDGKGDEGSSNLRNADGSYLRGSEGWKARKAIGDRYGAHPANLGNMKGSDFDAIVSSPPYADMLGKTDAPRESDRQHRISIGRDPDSPGSHNMHNYSKDERNLGNMKNSDFDIVVSSPPYGEIAQSGGTRNLIEHGTGLTGGARSFSEYGDTEGQLGKMSVKQPETGFWYAARQIVSECYALLRPGGHAIWVVKDYLKDKKVVPFCEQWRLMCETTGFETVCQHRAMQVEVYNSQPDMFGNVTQKVIQRKGFFRLQLERKGLPPIDWEMVICMQKPTNK